MPSRSSKLSAAGFLITLAGSILFSTKAVIVKKAFADIKIDALSLLTLRMVFSLPFYVTAAWLVGRNESKASLTAKEWVQVLVVGAFGYYISSYLDFEGLRYISAGLERLILFLYPTFVVFINLILFKQKINKLQWVALALTYTGIAIAYAGELKLDHTQSGFYLGSGLVFLCAITYAIYIAGSGKLIPKVGATRFTAYAMLSATAGIFIHFLVQNKGELGTLSGTGYWGFGIAIAIFATVLPSFLISNGLKRIGSNNVAIISSIGPVSTILQAHFILKEPIIMAQIVGTALVIIGVLLIGWRSQSAKVKN